MQLQFRTDELTAEEYQACSQVETTGDLAMAITLITRRATTEVAMQDLWALPVSQVHRLYREMAQAGLEATEAAMTEMRRVANLQQSIEGATDEHQEALSFFDQHTEISENN